MYGNIVELMRKQHQISERFIESCWINNQFTSSIEIKTKNNPQDGIIFELGVLIHRLTGFLKVSVSQMDDLLNLRPT